MVILNFLLGCPHCGSYDYTWDGYVKICKNCGERY